MSRQQAKDPRISVDVIYDDMVPVTGGAMTGDLTLRGQPAARVFTQSTAPSNPQAGDLWVDTSTPKQVTTPIAVEFRMAKTTISAFGSFVNSYTPTVRYTAGDWNSVFYIDGTVMRVSKAGVYRISQTTGFHPPSDTDSYYVSSWASMFFLPAGAYITGAAWVNSSGVPTRIMAYANANGSLVAGGATYGGFPAAVNTFTSHINLELLEYR